ncbi:MAG: hypothetical protein ACHQM6_05245 [Candidatus Kapaibacterium sp.]
MKEKRSLYLYPLFAAIILRLAGIAFIDTSKPATMEYGRIARNLLAGLGYAYSWFRADGSIAVRTTAYMPPGQVFIHYIFLGIFGDGTAGMIALYLFQILQACAFVYLCGKIAEFLFTSEKVTRATIWFAALYPPFVYVTMTFGVTSSAIVLNALLLFLGLQFSESLRTGKEYLKYSLLFGASCGLLLLFRGEAPVIVALTLVLITWQNRKTLRRTLLFAGLSGFIALAVLAPWTIRNYLVFDRFIPISTNGGFNLWRGNNPITTGSPWTASGGPVWSTDEIWAEIEPNLGKPGDFDKISSDVHSREAMKWIRENPSTFVLLSLKKAFIFWTFDLRSIMGGTFAYIAIYSCTLALLFAGIFYLRRDKVSKNNHSARAGFQIIVLWCALMTLISMIFFPLPRFQVLLVGIYLPVIGYGLVEIGRSFKRRISGKETGKTIVS